MEDCANFATIQSVLLELEKILLGAGLCQKFAKSIDQTRNFTTFYSPPPTFFFLFLKVEVYSSLTHFDCDSKVKAGSRLVKMVRFVREYTHSYLVRRFGVDVVM